MLAFSIPGMSDLTLALLICFVLAGAIRSLNILLTEKFGERSKR